MAIAMVVAAVNGLLSVLLIGLATRFVVGRLASRAIGDIAAVSVVAGYLVARITGPLPGDWAGAALIGRGAGTALGLAVLWWLCVVRKRVLSAG